MTSLGVSPALAIRHLADLKFIVAMPSVFVANREITTRETMMPFTWCSGLAYDNNLHIGDFR